MKTPIAVPAFLSAALSAAALAAQDYRDLTFVRNRPSPYTSLLSLRAGVLGGLADDEVPAIGLENQLGGDGHFYYHKERFAGREATLDAYAGRYATYVGVSEGTLAGESSISRLELTGRYFPFYREGFYQGDDFVPTGRYEGYDWGVSLSLGREITEDLYFEGGAYFRRRAFDRNEDTAPNYTIPDNYNAYGATMWLEHNTLALNRTTGRPDQGFIVTIGVEREQNDSDRLFGVAGIFESTLPSGVFRGRGHLEWYLPQGETGTWLIDVDAAIADKKDRVENYDAYAPQGNLWIDGQLGYRWDIGRSLWVAPFGKAQFLRILEENGVSSSSELFFGGGVDAAFELSDTFSILGHYSYLTNESREPVALGDDTFGEHRFFLGIEARLIADRRF